MVRARGDESTLDLLSWQPADATRRYEEDRVRANDIDTRIARAVAETLRDAAGDGDMSRKLIAERMSEFLGERVTVHMLNAYASPARTEHRISFARLVALIHATGDVRPLQMAAEPFEHVVVERHWLQWVKVGKDAEARDEARRAAKASEREFDDSLRAARRGGQ